MARLAFDPALSCARALALTKEVLEARGWTRAVESIFAPRADAGMQAWASALHWEVHRRPPTPVELTARTLELARDVAAFWAELALRAAARFEVLAQNLAALDAAHPPASGDAAKNKGPPAAVEVAWILLARSRSAWVARADGVVAWIRERAVKSTIPHCEVLQALWFEIAVCATETGWFAVA